MSQRIENWPSSRVLCAEIIHNTVTGSLRIIWSIPGRDGTMTRTWTADSLGRLSEAQYRDFQMSMALALDEFYLTSGAQLQLLVEP